jgi:hypothetical protein
MISRIVIMLLFLASTLRGQESVDSISEGLIFHLGAPGYSTAYRAIDAVTKQAMVPSNGVMRRGQVYEFDGTNDVIYVNTLALAWLHTNRNWTVEFWLRRNAAPSASGWRYVLGNANTWSTTGLSFGMYDTGASFWFYYCRGDVNPAPISQLSTGPVGTTWTHRVYTYDRHIYARSYRDGEFVQVRTNGTSSAITNSPSFNMQIGNYNNVGGVFFSGQIALLRAWNVCKTPDQIRAMYNDPPPAVFTEVTP